MIFALLLFCGTTLPLDYIPEPEPTFKIHECVPYKEIYTGFRQNGLSKREARHSAFHASKGSCYE